MAATEPLRKKKQVFEFIEFLESNYSKRDAMIFRMGVNTILRIGDLLKLKYNDVFDEYDEYRKYLVLTENKTGKPKKIPLNGKIRKHLRDYCTHYELTGDNPLFFSYRIPTKPVDRTWVWRTFNEAAKRQKIQNFGTHTMRKTLAYHTYQKTKDIGLVMKMLNHTNPAVTMTYIGIDQKKIDGAYRDVDLQF